MITAAQLDAAPVGSRVVFDWEQDWSTGKVIYRHTKDGWVCTNVNGEHECKPPMESIYVVAGFEGHQGRTRILPPRKPAAVRVWSWRGALGTPHYSWYCRVCKDFDVCFADSDEAHDKARSHASLHAEVTAP